MMVPLHKQVTCDHCFPNAAEVTLVEDVHKPSIWLWVQELNFL